MQRALRKKKGYKEAKKFLSHFKGAMGYLWFDWFSTHKISSSHPLTDRYDIRVRPRCLFSKKNHYCEAHILSDSDGQIFQTGIHLFRESPLYHEQIKEAVKYCLGNYHYSFNAIFLIEGKNQQLESCLGGQGKYLGSIVEPMDLSILADISEFKEN